MRLDKALPTLSGKGMIHCGVLFIHWIRFLICHASGVWQCYSEGLHQLETWHLSNLTLPVHHLSTNLAPILYSHATFTLLVNHTWPWPACSHLLGPLAVPIHHGSALSQVHAEDPSSSTYMGHLNELQLTITNSQQLSIPNFAPLSAIKCVYCTAQLKQRSLSIEFITGWNTDGVDG